MSGYAQTAFGFLISGVREIENYYERNVKEQIKTHYQPEASTPLACNDELSLKDKENIFKDIYSSIKLFDRIIYEASQELKTAG